jgi:hypothetical protein
VGVKNIIGGWRGVSLTKQNVIATAVPVNTLLPFMGDPMESAVNVNYVNTEQVTGNLLATRHKVLNYKTEGKHKDKATPHLIALFASMAMGRDTSTAVAASTAYKHALEIDQALVELPYRTMVENDGDKQWRFAGIACTGFTLSGSRGQFLEFEADLAGRDEVLEDGSTVPLTAKPALVNESYLTYCDANLKKGGTFAAGAHTGGTVISPQLKDFKFSFKNGGAGKYLFGDASCAVGTIRRGKNYEAMVEATIEIDDRAYRTEMREGTEFVMSIPIGGEIANAAVRYSVELLFPKVALMEAPKKIEDDGALAYAGKFQIFDNFFMNITNLQAASYLA